MQANFNIKTEFIVSLNSTGGPLSPSDISKGILISSPETEISYDLPSARDFLGASKFKRGDVFSFTLRNDGTSPITLKPGEGGTTNGSMTIPVSSYAGSFSVRFSSITTGSENYVVIRR